MKYLLVALCFFGYAEGMISDTIKEESPKSSTSRFFAVQGDNLDPQWTMREPIHRHIKEYLDANPRQVSEQGLQEIALAVFNEGFDPRTPTVYSKSIFWSIILKISKPISNLAQLGCTIVPMMSLGDITSISSRTASLVTSLLGVAGLGVGKIYQYAKSEVMDQNNKQLAVDDIMALIYSTEV
ncbi:MAG: hypothetical protein LBF57_03540 [Holosporaceae bacterium]|nr:hypothetical protein [Holosporaceae bacterium]